MRHAEAAAAVAGLLVCAACQPTRYLSPIIVDIASNCAVATFDTVLDDLDGDDKPWESVFAATVDVLNHGLLALPSGVERSWLLVSSRNESNVLGLSLVHVTDGVVDAEHTITGVDVSDVEFELQPGPIPGQAFLVASGPGTFRIWHVDAARPASPLVATSPDLGGFPTANNCDPDIEGNLGPCDTTDWYRALGFVSGNGVIVSVPPASPNATMFVHVGALGPGLSLQSSTQLEFMRECDPDELDGLAECNALEDTTYPSIDVLGFQRYASNRATLRVFMLRERAVFRIPQGLELVTARIELDESGSVAAILQSKSPKELDLIRGPPNGLAVDDFGAYLLHATSNRGPVITKLATGSGSFDVLDDIEIDEDAVLVQMDADIALARVDAEDRLEVTKLFPDAPERSETTLYETAGVESFAEAGVGGLLVRTASGGPELVRLRCADAGGEDDDELDEDGG